MSAIKVSMLTTIDNPFDPFTQYDEWVAYDERRSVLSRTDDNPNGIPTCSGYLGRMAHTSPALSPEENNEEIERAIDSIIRLNVLGIYRKVTKEL